MIEELNEGFVEVNEVFRRTQALGEALTGTEIYRAMRDTEAAIHQNPEDEDVIAQVNDARRAFSKLIGQVNQVLAFMMGGNQSGCGDCSGCSGCGGGCATED